MATKPKPTAGAYIHPTAIVEPGAKIGAGTQIWHHSHIRSGAIIGRECMIGYGCYVDAVLGRGCRVQNHVSIFRGVTLGDEVFVGPGVMFTNVKRPRASASRKVDTPKPLVPTTVATGASLGAGATVVCGTVIGAYAMVGAGATVTRDVPAHTLVAGTPARIVGYVCKCGAACSKRAPRQCRACKLAGA